MKFISAEKLMKHLVGNFYLPNVTKLKSSKNIEVCNLFQFPCSQSLEELKSSMFSGFRVVSVSSYRTTFDLPKNKPEKDAITYFVDGGEENSFDELLKSLIEYTQEEFKSVFSHIKFLPEDSYAGDGTVKLDLPKNRKLWVVLKGVRLENNTEREKRLKEIKALKTAFENKAKPEVDKLHKTKKQEFSVFNEFLKTYPQVDKNVLLAMVGKN